MPYGHPLIAMQLIDFDEGDDSWNGSTWEQMSEYLNERLISFVYDDSKRIDKLEMSFRNDDFALLEAPVFAKGQKLLVTWGWPGQTAAPRRVVVKKVKGGDPVIVTAHGVLSLLNKDKKHRFMEGVTDSEWVRIVSDEYGYKGNLIHLDETNIRRDITQPRWMTDAQMMKRLARRNGFDFYIDAAGLHWKEERTREDPIRVYQYRSEPGRGAILEPPVFEANLTRGVSKVRVLGYDPVSKKPVEVTHSVEDDELIKLGLVGELEDPDSSDPSKRARRVSTEQIIPAGLLTEEEATELARASYREFARKNYKVSLKIIGDALLGAKNNIFLFGTAEALDGMVHIKGAIHRIVPGNYVTELKCIRYGLTKKIASKMQRFKASNKNDNAQSPPPEENELKRMLTTITKPDGSVVSAYIFTDDNGATGQTSELTPADFNALSTAQKEALAQQGAQSAYPDI